jgi:hypothetical protein
MKEYLYFYIWGWEVKVSVIFLLFTATLCHLFFFLSGNPDLQYSQRYEATIALPSTPIFTPKSHHIYLSHITSSSIYYSYSFINMS